MNFVENNGKKVAAVLCVASAFPVVATVVAAKEEPGWHGDRYVNEDKTVAKGWQEIEGKTYYFTEDGSVDTTKTEKAVTASVSSSISGDVQETVATAGQQAVQEETEAKEAEAQAQAQAEADAAAAAAAEATTDDSTTTTDTTEQPADDANNAETPVTGANTAETPATPSESTSTVDTPEAPAQDNSAVETPSQDNSNVYTPEAPSQDTNYTPSQDNGSVQTPSQDTTYTPSQDNTATEAPSQDTTYTPSQDTASSDLGTRIAEAAKNLVGVTDGQWCTQIVQQALANAGVSDAMQLWPDQYVMYGYYTSDPQVGDLIYYNNGGRGVDHIAVYIGNGMAVHGNYWENGQSKTLIRSVNINGGAPQYIRVVR